MFDDRELTEARIRRFTQDHLVPRIHQERAEVTITAHRLEGEPIPLVAVVLTAVDQRTGGIFTAVLDRAQQELGDAERRTSTGLSIGMLTRQNSTEEEVEFLSRFIGTVEPGIAASIPSRIVAMTSLW